MTTVTVNTSKKYDVLIGDGLLQNIGSYVKQVKENCKIALISDSNVWPLYGETVKNDLTAVGFDVIEVVAEHRRNELFGGAEGEFLHGSLLSWDVPGEKLFGKMEELCSSGRLRSNLPVFPGPFFKNFWTGKRYFFILRI